MSQILLDTHALVWLESDHPRAKKLKRAAAPFAISPATLLEVQLLLEHGRIRLKSSTTLEDLADDERWKVDEPPARAWFEAARPLTWTRDPFDRIIVAHALYRGWRLATADSTVLEHLDPRRVLEL
ncbi:MAG TPA: PIN domain-containing protein [Planctomycetota bacterium]|nr:PIN domain-containing protein [Planctomycetota bacterium]